MPHVEYTSSPKAFVCVRCGSTNLAPGYIVDYGEKFEQIRFAPKRITLRWLNSILALRPWRSLAKVNAEACRDCGAVLLVVEPDELRRAEHRRD
jgi:ribosomal protein L40E